MLLNVGQTILVGWRMTACRLSSILMPILVLQAWQGAIAAPEPALPNSSKVTLKSQPPLQMPSNFDRETVQHLIDAIDQGRNVTVLKIGYVLRRGSSTLPLSDAYIMFKDSVAKEPVASKRWFILQSLSAFTVFFIKNGSTNEGFQAYTEIFSRPEEAHKIGADYALWQAISDYVANVVGRFEELRLLNSDETKEVFSKAWSAYIAELIQRRTHLSKSYREPLWAAAIERLGIGDEFAPVLETALQDPKVPQTYGLLQTAIEIYAPLKSTRALELLKQIKPLVPRNDKSQVRWYYNTLVALLEVNNRLPEAITAQQAYIDLTGQGQAKLAMLDLAYKDHTAFTRIIEALEKADGDAHEINDLAEMLGSLSQDKDAEPNEKQDAAQEAISLLAKYLEPGRERDIEQELRARKALGTLLIQGGKLQEAHAILITNMASELGRSSLLTPKARAYFMDIMRLEEWLSHKLGSNITKEKT